MNDDGNVQQIYEGGSTCPPYGIRKSIIQFLCSQSNIIASIQEPKVCEYHIWIGVPDVCDHPSFGQSVPILQTPQISISSWILELNLVRRNISYFNFLMKTFIGLV